VAFIRGRTSDRSTGITRSILAGEECDDGNVIPGDGCESNCIASGVCGNGVVDADVEEECDDGNTVDGDGCSSTCSFEVAAAALTPVTSGPTDQLEGGTYTCMLSSNSMKQTEIGWILAILGISLMSLVIKRSSMSDNP